MSGFRPGVGAREQPPTRLRGALSRVARLLLLLAAGAPAQCLWPPQYQVAPIVNEPVTIDPELLNVPTDAFYTWSGCPDVFSLDITNAIKNPDGDQLFIAWFVNYQSGLQQSIEDRDTAEYVFDPCKNAKVVTGSPPNIIEVWVLDRPPLSQNNADDFRTLIDPDTTVAKATWFFDVEDETCCSSTP